MGRMPLARCDRVSSALKSGLPRPNLLAYTFDGSNPLPPKRLFEPLLSI